MSGLSVCLDSMLITFTEKSSEMLQLYLSGADFALALVKKNVRNPDVLCKVTAKEGQPQ